MGTEGMKILPLDKLIRNHPVLMCLAVLLLALIAAASLEFDDSGNASVVYQAF